MARTGKADQTLQLNGQKVRELRTSKAWTQMRLAEESDLALSTIQKTEENPRHKVLLDTARRLSGALGVEVRELLANCESPSGGSQLAIRFGVFKRRNDKTLTLLRSGEVMTSDDRYGVYFEPDHEAYIYILQQDSNGFDVLFPNLEFSDQINPVPPWKAVWIPEDLEHWFKLDENVGREAIVVAATRERNEKLASLVTGQGITLGSMAELLNTQRGLDGVVVENQPILFPDGNAPDMESVLIEGSGAELVHRVEFEHK